MHKFDNNLPHEEIILCDLEKKQKTLEVKIPAGIDGGRIDSTGIPSFNGTSKFGFIVIESLSNLVFGER